jgi:hypothetical protein
MSSEKTGEAFLVSLFLSTTYPRPIPQTTAKPRFSPIRWDKDAHLLTLQ